MNIDEVINYFKSLEENLLAGVLVGFYYLTIAWTKIRDGLGINQKNNSELARLQHKRDFLKLRLEIETLKKKPTCHLKK